MSWSYATLLLMYLITAGIAATAAHFTFKSKNEHAARPLGITMVAVACWSLTYAFELSSPDLQIKLFWVRLEYFCISFAPFFYFIFSLRYTGHGWWLTPWRRFALASIPALAILLVLSNDLHGFYWKEVSLEANGSLTVLNYNRGWAFWLFILYSYSMVLAGTVLVISAFWKKSSLRSDQAAIVVMGVTAPWLLNILYVFKLIPLINLDLTPLAFAFSGLLISVALFRYKLLEVVPVARETIFENMGDGVMILDTNQRIVDINPVAMQILGKLSKDVIGRKPADVMQPGHSIFPANHPELLSLETSLPADHPDITLGEGKEKRFFSVQIADLKDDRDSGIGQMVLWREVTERKRSEEALRRQYEELSVLQAVAIACVELVDEDELINRATRIVGEALYPDNFGLMLVDESASGLRFHESYRGVPQKYVDIVMPYGKGITGSVAATGQPIRTGDTTRVPEYFSMYMKTRSELCVPVKMGERMIGVINAENARLDAFTEADERLLITIAGQLATAIDRLRASSTERRWMEKLAALYRASQEVISTLDAEQIYAATHRAVAQLMPADVFMVALLDAGQQVIQPAYFKDLNGDLEAPTIPAGHGMSGHVIESGQPLMIADIEAHPELDRLHVGPPPRVHAVLAVPMQSGSHTFGVLSAQCYQPNAYTAEDQQTLSTLANQVAIALEKARLFKQERMRASQMDALNTIIAHVAAATELKTLLDTTLEQICQVLAVEMAGIRIGGQYATLGARREVAELFLQAVNRTSWKPSRPLCIPDGYDQEAQIPHPLAEFMQTYALRASISVDIQAHAEHIGQLAVISSQPRRWSNEEIVLVEAVGRQLGVAAERLGLMDSIQSRLEEMTLLSQVIALTASAVDMVEAVQEICTAVAMYFNAPQTGFALITPDGSAAEVIAEFLTPGRPSAIGVMIPVTGNPSMAYILSHKTPLAVADAQNDPLMASVHDIMRQRGVASILLVPILVGDQVVGTLGIDDFNPAPIHQRRHPLDGKYRQPGGPGV